MPSWHDVKLTSIQIALLSKMPKRPDNASSYPSHELDRFIVRLPDGMRERLRAAAEQAGRSMNAEVVFRLEQSFMAPAREENLAGALRRMETVAHELAARLEAADPAFAATRAYFSDPKTVEEIYRRRAEEAKRSAPVPTSKPRRKKR